VKTTFSHARASGIGVAGYRPPDPNPAAVGLQVIQTATPNPNGMG